MKKILLVGAGQMGNALSEGWNQSDGYEVSLIDPNKEGQANIYLSLDELLKHKSRVEGHYVPDYIVFAVKPQVMRSVISLYKNFSTTQSVFISIAAGITIETMKECLGDMAICVRVMSNLPATVQCGLSALYTSDQLSVHQREDVTTIFSAVGEVFWVQNQDQIDQVTALSGSGPAYVFRLMEAMIAAGRGLGFSQEQAAMMTYQTFRGAVHLLERGELSSDSVYAASEWRKRVTSPGGTTQAALTVFENENIDQLFERVVEAAYQRAKEL